MKPFKEIIEDVNPKRRRIAKTKLVYQLKIFSASLAKTCRKKEVFEYLKNILMK